MKRLEKDSFGTIEVASEHLWGAQTQRSLAHFAISTERMPDELIHALAMTKAAGASVNRALGLLDPDIAAAIILAANEVSDGNLADEFPLSVWQTGSGTQTNMNLNEVLANAAMPASFIPTTRSTLASLPMTFSRPPCMSPRPPASNRSCCRRSAS